MFICVQIFSYSFSYNPMFIPGRLWIEQRSLTVNPIIATKLQFIHTKTESVHICRRRTNYVATKFANILFLTKEKIEISKGYHFLAYSASFILSSPLYFVAKKSQEGTQKVRRPVHIMHIFLGISSSTQSRKRFHCRGCTWAFCSVWD